MNAKNSVSALLITFVSLLVCAAPAQAQLFGGGGFGGGFGGGRPMLGGGGFGGGRPMIGGGAPIMRPSMPIARPALPKAPRPVIGGGPGFGGGRPIASLPNPGRPLVGNQPIVNRPVVGNLPGGDRPIAGNLPNIPGFQAPALPGIVRPGQPVNRDRLNDFLDNRPVAGQMPSPPDPPLLDGRPGDRPILGNRPILGDRPVINQPIMPSLGEKILGDEVRKEIIGRRVERAVHVRERVRDLYYRENHPLMYWRNYMWENHPVWSWWQVTAPLRWADWSSVSSWCGYSGSYAQPVTYEYTDQGVYANGQEVVVNDEYSKQARDLAAAGTKLLQQKIDSQEAKSLEWLPLGVYALSKSEEGDPTMFLQLTISREGIIAGSFANTTNNENLSVQGGADRESGRIAITIGDQDDVVIETGLYDVTEQQSGALLHHRGAAPENWLLVKMPDPQENQPTSSGSQN